MLLPSVVQILVYSQIGQFDRFAAAEIKTLHLLTNSITHSAPPHSSARNLPHTNWLPIIAIGHTVASRHIYRITTLGDRCVNDIWVPLQMKMDARIRIWCGGSPSSRKSATTFTYLPYLFYLVAVANCTDRRRLDSCTNWCTQIGIIPFVPSDPPWVPFPCPANTTRSSHKTVSSTQRKQSQLWWSCAGSFVLHGPIRRHLIDETDLRNEIRKWN